jgi:hypothetical protein
VNLLGAFSRYIASTILSQMVTILPMLLRASAEVIFLCANKLFPIIVNTAINKILVLLAQRKTITQLIFFKIKKT